MKGRKEPPAVLIMFFVAVVLGTISFALAMTGHINEVYILLAGALLAFIIFFFYSNSKFAFKETDRVNAYYNEKRLAAIRKMFPDNQLSFDEPTVSLLIDIAESKLKTIEIKRPKLNTISNIVTVSVSISSLFVALKNKEIGFDLLQILVDICLIAVFAILIYGMIRIQFRLENNEKHIEYLINDLKDMLIELKKAEGEVTKTSSQSATPAVSSGTRKRKKK